MNERTNTTVLLSEDRTGVGLDSEWDRERGLGGDDFPDSSMRWSRGQVNMIVIEYERNECHTSEEESSGNVEY